MGHNIITLKDKEQFIDERYLSVKQFEEILEIIKNDKTIDPDAKGAGSFCRYIEHEGLKFAVLSKRAQALYYNQIYKVATIINSRNSPVPIIGGEFGTIKNNNHGDFILIMPKIEGDNLPSSFYTPDKNIILARKSLTMTQEEMNKFVKTTMELTQDKGLRIDIHGANFIREGTNTSDVNNINIGTDVGAKIRFIDIKELKTDTEAHVIKKILNLWAFDKLPQITDPKSMKKCKFDKDISIDFMTSVKIVQAWLALEKIGLPDWKMAEQLKKIYDKQIGDTPDKRSKIEYHFKNAEKKL